MFKIIVFISVVKYEERVGARFAKSTNGKVSIPIPFLQYCFSINKLMLKGFTRMFYLKMHDIRIDTRANKMGFQNNF